MLALTEEESNVVDLIVKSRYPHVRVQAFEQRDIDKSLLLNMRELGILDNWEREGEDLWTFTPYCAQELGYELVEYLEPASDTAETAKWERAGQDLPPVRLPRSWRSTPLDDDVEIQDPTPGPHYLTDEWSGQPVLLFGSVPIEIDLRLGGKRRRLGAVSTGSPKTAKRA